MINSKKFINFGRPYIGNKENKFIQKVLNSKWIGTGPIVHKFEQNFSKYKKSKFAISVNSCTAALHLSIMTLGLKKGDEIITTPMTFCSTINSILIAGCKPVITDININTAEREFSQWCWTDESNLLKMIVPFKQAVYLEVINEFKSKIESLE